MRSVCLLALTAFVVSETTLAARVPSQYFKCVDQVCEPQPHGSTDGVSLSRCRTTCGDVGALWPMPNGEVKISAAMNPFTVKTIQVTSDSSSTDAKAAALALKQRFVDAITPVEDPSSRSTIGNGGKLTIRLDLKDYANELDTFTTDECYALTVTSAAEDTSVVVTAATLVGARHGMTTLSQLVAHDEISGEKYVVQSASIKDCPALKYRGLVLDTSRNFFPVDSIKQLITALGANKMNVFHWHLSDSSSFPIEFKKQPLVTEYGAYSAAKVYSQADISMLVAHGKAHGVRVIPELDAPSHMGAGWQWGKETGKGDYILCYGAQPWSDYCLEPPCGQLNPLNTEVRKVLSDVYEELADMFSTNLVHMGGDETSVPCWNNSAEIQKHFADNKLDTKDKTNFLALQGEFQVDAFKRMTRANKNFKNTTAIIWGSELTKNPTLRAKYFDKNDYVFQLWDAQSTKEITGYVSQGFRVIRSHYDILYLDCGYGDWTAKGNGWCGYTKSWQLVYDFPIYADVTAEQEKLVLGAEVALWSEMASAEVLSQRLWPKTAALAERLWANPSTGWFEASDRMQFHRYRMMQQGVKADMPQPEWCLINAGQCATDSVIPQPRTPEIQ